MFSKSSKYETNVGDSLESFISGSLVYIILLDQTSSLYMEMLSWRPAQEIFSHIENFEINYALLEYQKRSSNKGMQYLCMEI